jgi:hypothetical protein
MGKLTIANQYLSSEANELADKNDQYLFQKKELLKELKEWREATNSLKIEANKGDNENKEKKKYI